jgi:peroxidase
MELHMKYIWLKSLLARKSNRAKSINRPRTVKPAVEHLEQRCLMDVRSITGFGNNIADPDQGAGVTPLLRLSPVAYADGHNTPSLPNTINPRHLSNVLNNQSDPIFSFNAANPQAPFADNLGGGQENHLSDFSYVWGQFTDHDLDLTLDNSGTAFNIPHDRTNFGTVANPILDPMGAEPFTRSNFVLDANGVRQQVNTDTSFEDLSQVYGSTDAVASILRTHSGGRLRTSAGDLLPYESSFTSTELATLNRDEGGIANDAHQVPDAQLFVAGDKRVNENIELTAMHTVFMRNHNRLAGQLQSLHPSWTDQQLYQEARKLNIAEAEMVTYNELLPAIFGVNLTSQYTGYNPNVDPAISTEFSTVGFRFGHTLLSNAVGRDNNDGTQIADPVNANGSPINLTIDFFQPNLINNNHVPVTLTDLTGQHFLQVSSTVGEIMKADADNAANSMDLRLIDEIRNVLFGVPNGPGTDLAARDVQRARDHGIGTYNQVRHAFGLPIVTSYAQISSDPAVQAALAAAYGPNTPANCAKIDPFEGMLAEDHLPGTDAGPTESKIVLDQFRRLMLGDRFFFLNESFNSEELSLLAQGNSLAKILKNNTSITNLQANVFFFTEEISGAVFNNPEGDGVRHTGDTGIPGVTVDLFKDGTSIAQAVTDVNGEYDFTDLTGIPGTGHFAVVVELPTGYTQNATQAAHNPGDILLSRGGLDVTGQNFALLFTGSGATQGGGGLGLEGVALPSGSSNDTVGLVNHFGIYAVEQATVGSPAQFTIVALDASDHVVTGYTGTLHFTSTDGGASLPIDYTFTSDDLGSHLFSVTFATADDQIITAMDVSSDSFFGGAIQFTVL